MQASPRWHLVRKAQPPWGDYGAILVSGMTRHQPRNPEGLLRLERTGPFVPPITLAGAGDLLVTGAFRAELERSPLAGLEFRPVEKTHIVRLDWERWDLTDDEPPEYPHGGEPEGYILDRPHDPELAGQIGPIWEVVLPGIHQRAGADLARGQPASWRIYASQRAKDWLEQHASRWLSFAGQPLTPPSTAYP
jgi:hypothetical protein